MNPLFNGKVTLQNALQNSPTNWDVEFSFTDAEGVFGGDSVMVGDVLLLDTSNYTPGTITRYKILSISVQDFMNVSATIEMDDNNFDPPDLSYVVGLDGAIGRPTGIQKLNTTVAPGTQLLPDKFAEYPRNADMSQRVEYLGWKKFSFTYEDFSTGSDSLDLSFYELPANVIIEKVIIKHTEAFSGGAISAYHVSIGVASNEEKYASAFDVLQTVSDSARQISTTDEVESFDTTTNLMIHVAATDADLDQATSGALYVLIKLGAIQV